MSSAAEVVLDAESLARAVRRMAVEIVESTPDLAKVAIVGIRRGGVPFAEWLAKEIHATEGVEVPVGTVDIALYRDDASFAPPDPKIGPSRIDFPIAGWDVVLVDDVLQTGRTVRAALGCLQDYGRARRVWLACLCDRGGRELPIRPDFSGRSVEVGPEVHLGVEARADAKWQIVSNRGGEGT